MRIGLVDVDGKRFPNLALKDRNMEQSEIWKDIVGFEGMYQVSNKGRVKSIERTLTYKNGRIHHYPEHVLHQQKDTRRGKDYMIVCLTDGKKKYSRQVHRLVAEAFIPNPDKLP